MTVSTETTGIDWKAVRAELDSEEWIEAAHDEDSEERTVFLGTVFALYPSGKYHMPWACSNVTEDEADKDEEYREMLETEAEDNDLWITSGEGDPCDILVGESRDKPEPEPEDEDYMISDSGPLGSLYSVAIIGGRFVGEYATLDEAIEAISAKMDTDKFWPSVWYISDHGNVQALDGPFTVA